MLLHPLLCTCSRRRKSVHQRESCAPQFTAALLPRATYGLTKRVYCRTSGHKKKKNVICIRITGPQKESKILLCVNTDGAGRLCAIHIKQQLPHISWPHSKRGYKRPGRVLGRGLRVGTKHTQLVRISSNVPRHDRVSIVHINALHSL